MNNVQYLTDDEIKAFLDELDHNKDGQISYAEVEQKLDAVHDEIAPHPAPHNHLHHDSKEDHARHAFLRAILGSSDDSTTIPRDVFAARVKEWNIPSRKQESEQTQSQKEYMRSLGTWRRVRSYWAVHGPELAFLGLVGGMMIAFGVWQCVKYATTPQYQAAFGWGVVLAKTCAGMLYPTFFFLILSMSRYLSTALRRSYYVSRFINWDLSQEFHIRISCVALVLASLHAIGHLTGSFVWGSRAENEEHVAALLGPDAVPRSYIVYVRSVPGWTGLTALGLFYTLALMSMPQVRKWNYEVFQLGHLLMFPIIGLLMAHGATALLQWPMFGYWLAFPTLLVLIERLTRIGVGLHRIPARLKLLDSETAEIKAIIPSERIWKYRAGQYVFLQVPALSKFQWHPFTVSICRGKEMRLHIKTDGNWTGQLRNLAGESGVSEIQIGINGPFGAPAQRFYDFSSSVIVGAGIGVTPFSGILADLQARHDKAHGKPNPSKESETFIEKTIDHPSESNTSVGCVVNTGFDAASFADDYRRVDFHWMVRDRNHLLWFSDLLNYVNRAQQRHAARDEKQHLDIQIQTHVTQKRKSISTHVYRWLLEMHRTPEHPASPLTGLLNPTQFGRPDFVKILDAHYVDMLRYKAILVEKDPGKWKDEEFKVGVFFCGTPIIGEILADRCRALSARGRADGSRLEYHFMLEVFG